MSQIADDHASIAQQPTSAPIIEETSRLILSSIQRATMTSTSRLTVEGIETPFTGVYGLGTVTVLPDRYLLQYKRAALYGNARLTLAGSSDVYIFDFAHPGRIVLAGRG